MSFLDPTYSTTRMLTSQRPTGVKELPPNTGRVAEGGLRTKGYYKSSVPGKPLVSVITAVYNRVDCIERCIQSIITQSYENVEFIVIDGHSTDGTIDLLRKYNDQIDYWVSEPDQGLYYAMNKAVEIATGDWFYFFGSDDVLLDCLAVIVPQLLLDNTIYCGDVYGIARKQIYNGPFLNYKFYSNRFLSKGIHHQGMFYPRSVFSNHKYDVAYKIAADWDLNLLCYIENYYHFSYIQAVREVLNDIDGLSSKEFRIRMKEGRYIIRKRLGLFGLFYTSRMSLICLLETLHCKEPIRKFIIGGIEIYQKLFRSQKKLHIDKQLCSAVDTANTENKYSSMINKLGL